MLVTNLTPGTINAGYKSQTQVPLMLVTNLTPGTINAGDKSHTRYHKCR